MWQDLAQLPQSPRSACLCYGFLIYEMKPRLPASLPTYDLGSIRLPLKVFPPVKVVPLRSPRHITQCARTGPLHMFFSLSGMPLACSPLFSTPILEVVPPRNLDQTSSHLGSPCHL